MNVSSLTPPQLCQRLSTSGLWIRTGAFVTHLQTSIDGVAEGIALLYRDYPLETEGGFADFHVRLASPRNARRWLRPQVQFLFDGHAPFKPLPFEQAFPMFEWGLNWCISSHANTYLIVHAAVVEKNGWAAILPAPPGSGKSTLCAALVNRGWRLLSDELAMIRLSDGKLVPLPRPVSLKNASIEIIRDYEPSVTFGPTVADTTKGTVAHMRAPAESVARASETVSPAWIIFPKYQPGADACLSVLPKARAFMRVAENTFNYSLLGATGFETLGGVIDAALCYDFVYSKLDDAIEIFAALKPPVPGCDSNPTDLTSTSPA